MCVTHFFHIFHQFISQFPVCKEPVFLLGYSHPASQLYLIYIHRRPVWIACLPLFYPLCVFPTVHAQIVYNRSILRSFFHVKSIRVAFVRYVVIPVLYPKLISVKFSRSGYKYLPYSGITQHSHLSRSSIPVVKRAYNAYALRIWRPYGKGYSFRTVYLAYIRA